MTRPRQPLTPALLGRFKQLGVTCPAVPAPPEPPAQLSTQELKERGWSATMIARLLPTHDATRANQLEVGWSQKPLAAPVKLYDRARVEAAEATEAFRLTWATAEKARQAAAKGKLTRAEQLQAYLAAYVPQLADPPAPLFGHALWRHHLDELTAYEQQHAAQYRTFSRTTQKQASSQLYAKHRTVFLKKFGTDY